MATVSVTPQEDAVVGEIFIAAPPERVFQAITDPKQAPLWWGQKGMYRITEWKGDVRPGGKWSSAGIGDDGTKFRVDGEYPKSIHHGCWSSIPGFAGRCSSSKTFANCWESEPRSVGHGLRHRGRRIGWQGTC